MGSFCPTVLKVIRYWSYFWCFGLADSEGFSEVGVHGVIGLPLSLGGLDPVGDDLTEQEWEEAEMKHRAFTS